MYDFDVNAVAADNTLAGKQKALEAVQATLAKALIKVEQQRLQIESFNGRSTALRLASDEAKLKGKTWDITTVRRFSSLPKGSPDFASDALREMLDQARGAVDRRVREAVREGAKARAESEKSEVEGEANLEEAYTKCKEPAVELALRQAVEKFLVRNTRMAKRLRMTMKRLEDEAITAQTAHATDLRALSTRLVAQRDACAEVVLSELQQVEFDGALSLRGLQEQMSTSRATISERDATIKALQSELQRAQVDVQEERAGRQQERHQAVTELTELKAQVSQLKQSLSHARRETSNHIVVLKAELQDEEAGRISDARAAAAQMVKLANERDKLVGNLDARMRQIKVEARNMHSDMLARLKMQDHERLTLEQQHENDRAALETEMKKRETYLRGKIEHLTKQVLVLRGSSSRGRALLYWNAMKETRDLHKPDRGLVGEDDEVDFSWPPSPEGVGGARSDATPMAPTEAQVKT